MIPLSAPDISSVELAYVAEAMQSTFISSFGPFLDRFESSWAMACQCEHAVAVSNGTAALTVAMQALGVGPGDEVIVPAFTFAAVAGSVFAAGGRPVYADVDPDTWCIDPASVASVVSSRTAGIVAVHSYGHPAPVPALAAVARRHGLWVLEDGAEAHLARLGGRRVGSLADAAAFSFFGNKIIAAGEGGAVTTSDAALARRVRTLANQGVAPGSADRYAPVAVGANLRMTNLAAAVLCAQVERAEVLLTGRRAVEDAYRERLGDLGLGWQRPSAGVETVPWLTTVLADDRDGLDAALGARGVQARRAFPAIPDLDPYRADADVPVSRRLAADGLSLPTASGMTAEDVAVVVGAVRHACQPLVGSVR